MIKDHDTSRQKAVSLLDKVYSRQRSHEFITLPIYGLAGGQDVGGGGRNAGLK